MYRLSVGVTTGMGFETADWIASHADTLGIDAIWIGEDIGAGQDTSVLASSMILRSTKVEVGTGIVPVTMHNIATIARMALTLHEISDGRFSLGIGIGGTQDLRKAGVRIRKPVTALRESTLCLRSLWEGQKVTAANDLFSLDRYSLRLGAPVRIPIFYGVRGPQMLTLAGELSDGVILSGPFDYIERAISIVREAAVNTGRDPAEVRVVVWVPTIPTFRGIKEKTAKRIVALVVADTPQAVVEMLSLDREKIRAIGAEVARSGPKSGAALVDDEILNAFSISGSKEHMVDQFQALHEIGADEVVLGPPFSGEWKIALAELATELRRRNE